MRPMKFQQENKQSGKLNYESSINLYKPLAKKGQIKARNNIEKDSKDLMRVLNTMLYCLI